MLVLTLCLNIVLTAQNTCAVFTQIKKHAPKINNDYALILSESIILFAKKYDLKPNILTAIIRQESNFKMGAFNKKSKDFGLTQINVKTIGNFNFDKNKIMTNIPYSIEAGAIVLSDFKKRYFKKEGYGYWCRYNTSNPIKRQNYRKLVSKFL